MRKYGESKTTRITMANVPHVTSGLGLRKFQADGFLFDRVYASNTIWILTHSISFEDFIPLKIKNISYHS